MKDRILKLLGRKDYVPANVDELARRLRLPVDRQPALRRELRALERAGDIARVKGDRYILPQIADLIPGRIQITRGGRGFLTPDDPKLPEIAIPAEATGTALHEDHVLVRLDVRPTKARSAGRSTGPTGSVVRVLERRRTRIVGTLHRTPKFLYVAPDDPRMPQDIYVPEPRDVGRPARMGDKVVVELGEWQSRHTNPEGEIIEVLGPPDAEGVDMLGVLRHYGLPLSFPRKVLREVRRLGDHVSAKDRAGRTDCRRLDVVTIDPDDARDFDDAFHLQRVGEGQWKLQVHIADVSHYVKPGSALDEEARRRGNSTYLVDRVIPMLPEALSNELCSLKPEVDRLTKCVEFILSNDGRVLKSRCFSAVIHSRRRFTYQEALKVLRGKARGPIEKMLHDAHRLAQKIRRRRFRNGSLDFDFPEYKIRLDERGRVSRIERMENDESHQLIEEFMLLANEAVAEKLTRTRRPTLYRVHEQPESGRLAEYRDEVLSHHIPCGNLSKPGEVQKLLRRLDSLPAGPALKIGFLKSLMRARYAAEPLGHYGLAKRHYTHFTSPIRRYADLVVHRSLFEKKAGAPAAMKELADHLSRTERNSADAERDSRDVKLYAYLNAQLRSGNPERYRALVIDIRNFGFFVDVETLGMSGLVPLSDLDDDFYVFQPERHQLVGRRTRRVIRLGSAVEVQVAKVDTLKKRVDFRLAGKPKPKAKPRASAGRKPKQRPAPAPSAATPPPASSKRKARAKSSRPKRSARRSSKPRKPRGR